MLQGPLAVPPTVALAKVLFAWGARLTWTAHREHAAQIIRAVEGHKNAAEFLSSSRPTVHEPAGRGSGLAGVWLGINQEFEGICNRGFTTAGGENLRGLSGPGPGLSGIKPGISQVITGINNCGFSTAGGEIGRGPAM